MKTEKQIREKLHEIINAWENDIDGIELELYLPGVIETLDWVLDDNVGEICMQRRIDDDARREYLEYRIEQDDRMWK